MAVGWFVFIGINFSPVSLDSVKRENSGCSTGCVGIYIRALCGYSIFVYFVGGKNGRSSCGVGYREALCTMVGRWVVFMSFSSSGISVSLDGSAR